MNPLQRLWRRLSDAYRLVCRKVTGWWQRLINEPEQLDTAVEVVSWVAALWCQSPVLARGLHGIAQAIVALVRSMAPRRDSEYRTWELNAAW